MKMRSPDPEATQLGNATQAATEPLPFLAEWLRSLNAGAAQARQDEWTDYLKKLIARAGVLSRDCPPGSVDPESVAASVFASLVKGVNAGRLRNVNDHDNLWWLLLAMVRRKVADRVRSATTQKRGAGKQPVSIHSHDSEAAFIEITGEEPTPEHVAAVQDEFEYLLSKLPDSQLKQIAVLRIEGYTSSEIADQIGVAKVTVDRKLKRIRLTWAAELDQ